MKPIEYYLKQCEQGKIASDPVQLLGMQELENLYDRLTREYKQRSSLWAFWRRPKLVTGIYLWGGVGVGKTLMMDCFYHCLPFQKKMRMHFYEFMQLIHAELTKHQGEKDPLQVIASDLARKTIVICFDELFVSDITDAMLLGRLFKALFLKGVSLVATSNVAPDDLYKNGLQRISFLSTIALLKQNMIVYPISSAIDYRLRHLKEAGVFYTPLDEHAKLSMEKSFAALTEGEKIHVDPIKINDRLIPVIKEADNVVWFEFFDICHVPRSQQDYLAIAKKYKTVFISDIPIISPSEKDTICLFISLVDVMYDAKVRMVISAAEPVEQIYSRGYMVTEYTRTHSRLLEMQSMDYFGGED